MGERGRGEGDLLTSKTHLHQTPKPLSYCENTDLRRGDQIIIGSEGKLSIR